MAGGEGFKETLGNPVKKWQPGCGGEISDLKYWSQIPDIRDFPEKEEK